MALSLYTATYDGVGNRQTVQELDGIRVTYAYDSANQLVNEQRSGVSGYNTTYIWDSVGNRLNMNASGQITTIMFNAANEVTVLMPPSGQPTTSIWDAMGNLVVENVGGSLTSYTWDSENRLLSAVSSAGAETYTYSANGLRETKITGSGTIHYVLDAENVLMETDETLATQAVYTDTPGIWGRKFSLRRSGNSSFYLPDHQGHSRQLTNNAQVVTDAFLADAWGDEIVNPTTTNNPYKSFGQWGYYRDQAQRFYVRARHLRPDLGRWMSRDPLDLEYGDSNQYKYALNQPTAYPDPSGEYVVLIRGGEGHPESMTLLKTFIEKGWEERVFEPLYDWTLVEWLEVPRTSPPTAPIVVDVLHEIENWLADELADPLSSDCTEVFVYGHSYGGHIAGQIASGSDARVRALKERIERTLKVKFVRYVTSVGWANKLTLGNLGYPEHFTNIDDNLYSLAGDPSLIRSERPHQSFDFSWREIPISWWNPEGYNTRNLHEWPFNPVQRYWFDGSRDYVCQTHHSHERKFKHFAFDGQSGLCFRQSFYQKKMHMHIASHLLQGHPRTTYKSINCQAG